MKRNKIIALFAIGILSLSSCEDAYDIVQDGELNEAAAFQTVGDMSQWMVGTYDQASMSSAVAISGILTDELGIGNQSGGQNLDLYKYILDPNDSFSNSIWLGNYTLINYCNRLLRGAERVTPSAEEQAAYNSILAEAKALRAFGYLQLLTYFSPDMKDDNALGVILIDRVPRPEEDLPRSKNGDVYALMEADLNYAEANLVDRTDASAYKYVTHNMINAVRARMYAYRGNYAAAEQYADALINSSGVSLTQAGTVSGSSSTFNSAGYPNQNNNFYSISGTGPTNTYAKMWGDFAQGEILFALARPAVSNQEQIAANYYFNRTNLAGGPYHDMDYNLFELLDDPVGDGRDNNDYDIRRLAYVDPTSIIPADPEANPASDFRNLSVICIDKYRGKSGPAGSDLVNDHKVFRIAEMYLIKAEARIAAGDLVGAATLIKTIRDARIYTKTVTGAGGSTTTAPPRALPVYANATEAWADLLKERRVELAFEGHRYIDLKRLATLAGVTNDRFHRECESNNVPMCTLPNGDHRYTLPIPRNELNANANMEQNPGY